MAIRNLTSLVAMAVVALGADAALAQGNPKVLKVVAQGDLRVLDPIWTTGTITQNHGNLVYDLLFAWNEKLEATPQMVSTWNASADGLTYTFTLRDGLAFHDGSPVTSKDVIPSIARFAARDIMGQRLYKVVADVKAVDDKTFTMTLKEPYGLVASTLGRMGGLSPVIMREAEAKTDPHQQVTTVIGSGPFKFKQDEWVPGAKVVYVKNDAYKPRSEAPSYAAGGKVVHLERVEWLYIPDPATIGAALGAGEIDFWETPTSDLLPILRRNKDIVLAPSDPLGTQGILRPNHLYPPFDNPKARQALVWLTNQEDYLRASVSSDPNDWKVCPAMFVCGSPNETLAGAEAATEKDPKKRDEMAKRLFAESGYKGEPIHILQATDFPAFNGAALVLADALKRIGANPQLVPIDWNSVLTRRAVKKPPAEGGWNVFFTSSGGLPGSSPFANPVATDCDKAWFGWPCDAEIEKLRDAWTREADPKKQFAIIETLQRRMFEQVPYVTYGQWFQQLAYRSNVKGVITSPQRYYWNTRKE
ncbi:MAG: ABC transporter substrate-binding protein [Rhodospirillaceae bacterium]|nr:ABC transporter substrate-binding protein [Rhodospirillaceae bacterium]